MIVDSMIVPGATSSTDGYDVQLVNLGRTWFYRFFVQKLV